MLPARPHRQALRRAFVGQLPEAGSHGSAALLQISQQRDQVAAHAHVAAELQKERQGRECWVGWGGDWELGGTGWVRRESGMLAPRWKERGPG